MTWLTMEDKIQTEAGTAKREEQGTQHLHKRRAFRLPRNHQQKHVSHLPQHGKA
jgi:hypothetical protein